MNFKRFIVMGAALPLLAAEVAAQGQRWWRHVEFLADDKLQGRLTGSEGHRKAAEYVAAEFEKGGLKPGGTTGYFQAVQFQVREIREERSLLVLVRGGIQELVRLGEDAYFNLRTNPPGSVEAPAVFVGYGLTVPESNYDDLAAVDLRGKIAVFLRGGPRSIPGPLRAHYQSPSERWNFLRRAGAIGTAVIPDPRSMDIPWERATLSRLQPFMSLADDRLAEMNDQKLSLVINPESADKFFVDTDHTIAEILELAEAGRPLPKFPLAVSIRAGIAADRSEVESSNVIGLLEGTDPRLKNEYVLLSAHLDHVGVGSAVNGDPIYNGAMDNAAGVASLLEIARSLSGSRLRRSVLFLAATAEEKGLLGSKYFAAFPTVEREQIVANLNIDMFLPLHSLRILNAYGLEESSLGPQLRAVARRFGIRVQGDPEPERNLFIRSDQYSFIRAGVPALAFKFGFVNGSPEERLQREWLKQRYHAPSDDANQTVNRAAAARFNRLIAALATQIANSPRKPQWNAGSFFRRFATWDASRTVAELPGESFR